MLYLALVSLIWAFSFGLTKGILTGLDSAFISAARLLLALVVFLPFLRPRGLNRRTWITLTAIGAIQFGVMYLTYNESYRHLAAHEVALFSLTTPLFVALLADALDKTLRPTNIVAALIAIAAAGCVTFKSANIAGTVRGILLMQISNLCFAAGQIAYRRLRAQQPTLRDRDIFALLYLGAVALVIPVALLRSGGTLPAVSPTQLSTLIYLGIISSGLCFFWWNLGAIKVNAGTLSVFNNAKVPLAVACSILFFHEQADLPKLALSSALLLTALWLATRQRSSVA